MKKRFEGERPFYINIGRKEERMLLKEGLTIALLAYKEAENLNVLIPQIRENADQLKTEYEIVVVDTEQPLDNTAEVCAKYSCTYINQKYPKFGGAFRTAIEAANYDKFLIMDGDGSHPPAYIPDMYRMFTEEHCDVVIGSRYVKGGVTQDSKTSIIMSKILNTVFRIALGIRAHDISTDFRIYRTELLKAVTLENQNYDVLQEVLLKIKMYNGNQLKIGEVPITFRKRMFGESKRQLIPFIISYMKSLFRLSCIRFSSLKNLLLYGLIGGGGAIVEFAVFSFLLHLSVLEEVSNIAGAVCGFAFTFTMNTFLNFRKSDRLFQRFLSYGTICLLGMAFSTFMISLFKDSANIYWLKIGLMLFVAACQFVLNKKITYRD